jgi:hypothetical protein
MAVNATDWFRIRHREPFSEETFATFRASCAVYRAKLEAIFENWESLPTVGTTPKPTVHFLEPELSEDRRVMSLPLRVEGMTLGSRSLLQQTASRDLYAYLPFPLVAEIEVGLTERAFSGDGWREDWWNPHKDSSLSPKEAFGRLGYRVHKLPFTGQSVVLPADTSLGSRLLAVLRSWWEARRGRVTSG